METDRGTELGNGSLVGRTTIDVAFLPATGGLGYMEYIVFKAQRQAVTPVVGTHPIPSDAEVIAAGLQQTYRSNMPGWIIQYGMIMLSREVPMVKKIKIDWNKFKMSKTRDGDFFGITYFNNTQGNVTIDWNARYVSRH